MSMIADKSVSAASDMQKCMSGSICIANFVVTGNCEKNSLFVRRTTSLNMSRKNDVPLLSA